MPASIQIKRVYEKPDPSDGLRVLVDRLWPRGVSRRDAKIDVWLKDAAPSSELRRWFDHDPAKWAEFKKRYTKELAAHKDALRDVLAEAGNRPITLVFGARDTEHSNAAALKPYLARLKPR